MKEVSVKVNNTREANKVLHLFERMGCRWVGGENPTEWSPKYTDFPYANEIYNYLKERIGDTVDDMKEFDAWFERMVWHVKECDRLTAESKRVKGRWIEMLSYMNHTYKCSECGRLLVNVTDGKNNVSEHYPYCHCGADMRGGDDESTI